MNPGSDDVSWVEEGSPEDLDLFLETSRRVGAVIRERRLQLDLTQQQAAASAGVSPTTWRSIERGSSPGFRDLTLRSIARALDWPTTAIGEMFREDGTEAGIQILKWVHHGSAAEPGAETVNDRLAALEEAAARQEAALDQILAELRSLRGSP